MTIANAHRYSYGFSIIELLVASFISLMVLAVVTGVFISGFNSFSQRSLQLMVAQDANDALKILKEDILRAGYNSSTNSSFVISGAASTVYIKPSSSGNSNCIAYGYNDGKKEYFRSYYLKDNKLNFYATKDEVITTSTACEGGKSVLDNKQLKVTKFELTEKKLTVGSVNSKYITINLEIATRDDAISAAKTITVKTRNWT
ncbi:PilW family protein [Photobacterium marinum]|uniref:PilW family protein n=1 Tax=Photobacterium marinum TaxID=1056511 RepID=UPI000567FA9D|nr:prepilin-type N-terminal cleavage/methylation domain-containing protein [Photobacterium marinum]